MTCEAFFGGRELVAGVLAREVFFVDWRGAPSAADSAALRNLLRSGEAFAEEADGCLVLPRFGAVSPWSSKATNIAARCGVRQLRAVERGWWVACNASDASAPCGGASAVCDRMTQQILRGGELSQWRRLFAAPPPVREDAVPLLAEGKDALRRENDERGLALSEDDMEYLSTLYAGLGREPSVAELVMFAQANSEHCRHKIFNARWSGDDDGDGGSLMDMIRRTHAASPDGVVTAFADNAAIIHAAAGEDFAPDAGGVYRRGEGGLCLVAKAETHNHPTAVSPYFGAATGAGGEIRDETAAGRGGMPLAGFSGYIVSGLDAGDALLFPPPPANIAPPFEIMRAAPLGAAAFNNEFGRPTLAGFFRSYEATAGETHPRRGRRFGFHKPVMLAGGVGQMLPRAAGKRPIPPGAKIIQLGGAGFRIGIGGGGASSRAGDSRAGDSRAGGGERLDFASVQRDNAEMQRRAQAVLDVLRRRPDNPLLSLHDVGAGGLANAVGELVHSAGRGARLSLANIPLGEQGMTAAEIWCNESQERYVLALLPDALEDFGAVCARECCPWAVLGEATEAGDIVVADGCTASGGEDAPVHLPLAAVFGDLPRPTRRFVAPPPPPTDDGGGLLAMSFDVAALSLLRHPTAACKRFLITIGDRTVGGLTAREQMVGPWQTPVADCAAVCNDFDGFAGAAFALGERPPVAAANPAAASRLAIAEALLNLAAADVAAGAAKLSLNWMANCAAAGRDSELRCAVSAAADFCVALGVGVIVGKDSLFMRMPAAACGGAKGRVAAGCIADDSPVESPAFAAAFAFAPLADVRRIWTPQLSGRDDTVLLRLDLSGGKQRLGGCLAFSCGVFSASSVAPPQGAETPDIAAAALTEGLQALAVCRREGLVLSYHDCSDGGLWVTLCEMAFAANVGLDIFAEAAGGASPDTDGANVDGLADKAARALFHEEAGVVLEAREADAARVMQIVAENGGGLTAQTVARPQLRDKKIRVYAGGLLLEKELSALRQVWEETGGKIAAARDNPTCVEAELQRDMDSDPGLFARIPPPRTAAGGAAATARPRVVILREQGTNGHREMAAAFDRAGFDAVDVTMTDLLEGRLSLDGGFSGAALCGGFSFGDVLGAGRGWAMSILSSPKLSDMFAEFFHRDGAFVLGVCNGCQALAQLQPLMADATAWRFPHFRQNESRRFEARLTMTEVLPSPSPLFADMNGLMYPLVVSHGEGRAVFSPSDVPQAPTILRYVDNHGAPAVDYPYNPNGSADGATGFCSPDGRVTILMPHPERACRNVQMAWLPPQTEGEETPWMRIFTNARRFAG